MQKNLHNEIISEINDKEFKQNSQITLLVINSAQKYENRIPKTKIKKLFEQTLLKKKKFIQKKNLLEKTNYLRKKIIKKENINIELFTYDVTWKRKSGRDVKTLSKAFRDKNVTS